MVFTNILEIAASVIVALGGGGVIVVSLSGYLGKVWADRALEKQRQEYARLNLELTQQLALVTERVKSALQIRAAEHQVRFSQLHEKRAEVLADIYEQLVDAEYQGRRFVYVEGFPASMTLTQEQSEARREARQEIQSAMSDLSLFIEKRQIYLPASMCALLKTHLDNMSTHVYGAGSYGSLHAFTPDQQMQQERVCSAACKAFSQELPAARRALEEEFRKMLDAENSSLPDSPT
jgi:hypothetical protein